MIIQIGMIILIKNGQMQLQKTTMKILQDIGFGYQGMNIRLIQRHSHLQ